MEGLNKKHIAGTVVKYLLSVALYFFLITAINMMMCVITGNENLIFNDKQFMILFTLIYICDLLQCTIWKKEIKR